MQHVIIEATATWCCGCRYNVTHDPWPNDSESWYITYSVTTRWPAHIKQREPAYSMTQTRCNLRRFVCFADSWLMTQCFVDVRKLESKNVRRCEYCAKVHTDDKNCRSEVLCANCGGSHPASSSLCPVYSSKYMRLLQINNQSLNTSRQCLWYAMQSLQIDIAALQTPKKPILPWSKRIYVALAAT